MDVSWLQRAMRALFQALFQVSRTSGADITAVSGPFPSLAIQRGALVRMRHGRAQRRTGVAAAAPAALLLAGAASTAPQHLRAPLDGDLLNM